MATDYQVLRLVACVPGAEGWGGGGGEEEDFCVFVVRYMYIYRCPKNLTIYHIKVERNVD